MASRDRSLLLAALSLCVLATPAAAYIGPGLGAGALATVLGVIGSFFLLIVAVVYYPIKRMLKRGKSKTPAATASKTDASSK